MEFTSEFFSGNRHKLLETTGAELIVLTANGLLQRSADDTFQFRQDSNFFYLTGINEKDFLLVISKENTFLIESKPSEYRSIMELNYDKKELKVISGIDDIQDYHTGWTRLDVLLKKYKKAHTITPAESYIEHFGFYTNPARATLLNELKKHRKLELIDIRKNLARQRQIKQPVELHTIQQAIDITAKALKNVHKKLASYKYEYEAAADLTREFMRRGAMNHAFHPIVASGKHATVIHNFGNNGAIVKAELLLFDVGAEMNNYSADISRTYSISTPTKRQQAVYDAVLRVQKQAMRLLKPGVHMREYEKQVDKIMAIELKKLGLITDTNDKKKLKKYYPHLTSHFLGLDTHDAADYDMPLEPGMVLTVEPGIYIPEESIGVRIEDDVLITKTGIKILSSGLPTTLN